MDRYIGLDVHAQSTTVAVILASGKRWKSWLVETNGQSLVEAIRLIPGRLHVCLEEGTYSSWLYQLLWPHVEELVVTVPEKSRGSKSDQRDAWARAEELRTGAIRTRVFKAPGYLAGLRSAVRAHTLAVRDVVRVKNRLKAVLRSRGILADAGVYSSTARSKWLKQLPKPQCQLAQWLSEELESLRPLRDKAEQWVLKESKAHPIIRKLQTAPGMGPIRTAQLVAIVANPERFRTRRQFWSYSGLGIETHSSSDWLRTREGQWLRAPVQQTRGLTRKRQPLLKAVFKGAATTVIQQGQGYPLYDGYERATLSGIKPNLAKLSLARRIAATVLSMWKHQEVFDPRRHELTKA